MDWDERTDRSAARIRRHVVSRATRTFHCNRAPTPFSAACTAAIAPGTTPTRSAALFRAAGPDLTLGADVMVGFPGEIRSRIRRDARFYARTALRLPSPVSLFAAPRHAWWAAHAIPGSCFHRRRTHGRAARSRRRKDRRPPQPLCWPRPRRHHSAHAGAPHIVRVELWQLRITSCLPKLTAAILQISSFRRRSSDFPRKVPSSPHRSSRIIQLLLSRHTNDYERNDCRTRVARDMWLRRRLYGIVRLPTRRRPIRTKRKTSSSS